MLNKESCLFKVGTYSGPSVNGVALMPVWGPALIGGGGGGAAWGAGGGVGALWGAGMQFGAGHLGRSGEIG